MNDNISHQSVSFGGSAGESAIKLQDTKAEPEIEPEEMTENEKFTPTTVLTK